jgi:4-hydroxy-tetrahydrodipicolinate synthase
MKPLELKSKMKKGGVSFMLVTPFDENGELMLDAIHHNIEFLMEKTKNFDEYTITPVGSNGELAHLSEDEAKKVIKASVEAINGRSTVIVGTGRASAHETITLSRYAQDVGADGVQVVLPYYFIPTEEGMYEHYKAIAKAVDVGVVIYNNPAFSASWIKPSLMKKMIDDFGQEGKITAVKENTPHLMLFNSMVKALNGTGCGIYSGFGEQWYAYQYPWGADGLATAFGNFFPEYPIAIYKASKEGDNKTIKEWNDKMQPYYDFVNRCSSLRGDTGIYAKPGGSIYGEGNVRFGVVKAAMNIMGLQGGHVRLPMTMINDKERDELKEILKYLNLI